MSSGPSSLRFRTAVGIFTGLGLTALVALEIRPPDSAQGDAPAPAAAGSTGVGALVRTGASASTPDAIRPPDQAWRSDQVTVVAAVGADLDQLAADHGATVLRRPGRSPLATFSVPENIDREAVLADLRRDPRVTRAGRQGIVRGAGSGPSVDDQWHIEAGDFDEAPSEGDLSDYVVAVLDSGVAYAPHTVDGVVHPAAPCMDDVSIVAPRDVVNDDALPEDDHQHGTHIASTIVADCDVQGTAPGAALMPVKVLDGDNVGVEADLIEGILWAVDHHADVINMSLTFGAGYVPSPDLLDALAEAAEAGIVMVGASGNDGSSQVGWPAASPHVIAVGAACAIPDHDEDMVPAPYSNTGPEVDLLAPGGCLDRDVNDDGRPDGILAPAVGPGGTSAGYWLMAGTSQAAAVASGAAVRVLAAGAQPQHVRLYLQDESEDSVLGASDHFELGHGAGALDVEDAVEEVLSEDDKYEGDGFSAALLPMVRDNGDGTVTPGARFTVVEDDLDPAEEVVVYGSITGSKGREVVRCELPDNGDGLCTVWGSPEPKADAAGPLPLSWQVSIDRVADGDESHTPSGLLLASDELAAVVAELNADSALSEAVLGVWWSDQDTVGGEELAESWVVLSHGTGLSTSPFGVILTPPVLEPVAKITEGTGLSTSPFGLKVLEFGGVPGLLAPEGLTVVGFEGTGLSTSPFGVLPGRDLDKGVKPFCLADADDDGDECREDSFGGASLKTRRNRGGWRSRTGECGARRVAGSGLVSVVVEGVDAGAAVGAVVFED
jgi:hypothetical protein